VPDLDEDGPALLATLAEHGIEGVPAVWDDETVDWDSFDLVVVRSTWDYAERRDLFLLWAAALPRVLNPLPVLRWNTDKRYLLELERAGLPVVPTMLLQPGDEFQAPAGRFVVKPSVSAGSQNTASYSNGDAALPLVERLHGEGRTVMVQPYLSGIDEHGETALLYLGGRYSHAVRKTALLADDQEPTTALYLEETITATEATGAERALADWTLAALPIAAAELLYARVDLVPASDGPVVLEVELTEPSLWLLHSDGAADRLAEAIADAVRC
jgi:glutathione synthase/RimK-type ligase-like ATP-grasp enzyme